MRPPRQRGHVPVPPDPEAPGLSNGVGSNLGPLAIVAKIGRILFALPLALWAINCCTPCNAVASSSVVLASLIEHFLMHLQEVALLSGVVVVPCISLKMLSCVSGDIPNLFHT
jgi:hypothetical protein